MYVYGLRTFRLPRRTSIPSIYTSLYGVCLCEVPTVSYVELSKYFPFIIIIYFRSHHQHGASRWIWLFSCHLHVSPFPSLSISFYFLKKDLPEDKLRESAPDNYNTSPIMTLECGLWENKVRTVLQNKWATVSSILLCSTLIIVSGVMKMSKSTCMLVKAKISIYACTGNLYFYYRIFSPSRASKLQDNKYICILNIWKKF